MSHSHSWNKYDLGRKKTTPEACFSLVGEELRGLMFRGVTMVMSVSMEVWCGLQEMRFSQIKMKISTI